MPTYEYAATHPEKAACDHCRAPFSVIQSIHDPRLTQCPACGAPIQKQITAPAIAASRKSLDSRAKAAGFSKLRKVDKGTFEKEY